MANPLLTVLFDLVLVGTIAYVCWVVLSERQGVDTAPAATAQPASERARADATAPVQPASGAFVRGFGLRSARRG